MLGNGKAGRVLDSRRGAADGDRPHGRRPDRGRRLGSRRRGNGRQAVRPGAREDENRPRARGARRTREPRAHLRRQHRLRPLRGGRDPRGANRRAPASPPALPRVRSRRAVSRRDRPRGDAPARERAGQRQLRCTGRDRRAAPRAPRPGRAAGRAEPWLGRGLRRPRTARTPGAAARRRRGGVDRRRAGDGGGGARASRSRAGAAGGEGGALARQRLAVHGRDARARAGAGAPAGARRRCCVRTLGRGVAGIAHVLPATDPRAQAAARAEGRRRERPPPPRGVGDHRGSSLVRQGAGCVLAPLRATGARRLSRPPRVRGVHRRGRAERRHRQSARARRRRGSRLERQLPWAAARVRPRRARDGRRRAREHLRAAARTPRQPEPLRGPARLPHDRRRPQQRLHDPAVRVRIARLREQSALPSGVRRLHSDERGAGGSRLDGERRRAQGVAGACELRERGGDRAARGCAGGRVPRPARARDRGTGRALGRAGAIAEVARRPAAGGRHRGCRRRDPRRVAARCSRSGRGRLGVSTTATLAERVEALVGDLSSIRAPRGTDLNARQWSTEAPLRMLLNNLDAEVAERPEELVVYGGSGKAARNHEALRAIAAALLELGPDETLLVQSGKPVGVFTTHEGAPRVLIANSLLVPKWATWDEFRRLEAEGLTMFGQMTAGSWIYIGSQGILQGTYQTFAAAGEKHFGSPDLRGRTILTAGLGGMGGAQPLAGTMAGAAILCIEVDPARIERRLETRYRDEATGSLEDALARVRAAAAEKRPLSVGLLGNAADVVPELAARGEEFDLVTDQTAAHDPLNGYVPRGYSVEAAAALRSSDPDEYLRLARESIVSHVEALLEYVRRGVYVFDYGNNLRGEAREGGVEDAFAYPGFVPAYIRPLFCRGVGPFRWAALSGEPGDIAAIDDRLRELFPDDPLLQRWLELAPERVTFQGLPARICWLGYGDRAKAGLAINELVRGGEVKAPVVIGRDHLDAGSVASPYRETESMRDGSDAIADWPILNALVNTAAGATWVSVHHGGGVGIGNAIHAGMVVLADGTDEMAERLERVLTTDPGTGVMRHLDAGYAEAIEHAERHGLDLPGLEV